MIPDEVFTQTDSCRHQADSSCHTTVINKTWCTSRRPWALAPAAPAGCVQYLTCSQMGYIHAGRWPTRWCLQVLLHSDISSAGSCWLQTSQQRQSEQDYRCPAPGREHLLPHYWHSKCHYQHLEPHTPSNHASTAPCHTATPGPTSLPPGCRRASS